MKTAFEPETVGRTYQRTTYEVHSRRSDGEVKWYGGVQRFASIEAAQKAIDDVSKPILDGLVSFGNGKEDYEYRIVRVEAVVTVERVMHRKL